MSEEKPCVLVTGACGGIGREVVRLFSEHQWDVIGVDKVSSASSSAESIQADLASASDVAAVCERVRASHHRLDAIVNNAAEQITQPLISITPAQWDRVMAANVRPVYQLMAGLHDLLAATQGAVVNLGSVHAVATSPGMAAYVASKGAVVALTRAMALEFAPQRIRVNAVLPGAVDTPMLADGLRRSGIDMKSFSARHPLGRVGTPRDVAEAILFLADGRRSSFITGQTLVVDGGATARLSTE